MSIESIKHIYKGRVVEFNVERVRLPNGNVADLEILHHPGGAAVVAIDDANRVCLLYQFRHAAQGYVWELPAGKIDNREPPLDTARRELEEEGGATAARWESLGNYLSSPGVFTEVIHLFLARELIHVQQRPEEHEVFHIEWRPFEDVLRMAESGELRDGKSIIGIFRAHTRLVSEINK
jgi:8-oxo-dGTP pyrophosphatase MutT (NUDIX family)